MTDEDLLTTNNLSDDLSKDFLNTKKTINNKYDTNIPSEFIDIPNEKTTIFFSENSIGYYQFNQFADTEKKKKTIRTVVNVDSKNRKTNFSFKKILINQRANHVKLVYFYDNSEFFYIITDDTLLENYKFYKEVIFTNFDVNITSNLSNDKFIFNQSTGDPILTVNALIYNTVSNPNSEFHLNPKAPSLYNKRNYFDKFSNKYLFNIIEVQLPNKVNSKEINSIILNQSLKGYFVTDVKSSYTTASHYKISLDRSYSNIYNVRLVSSEIPNTAYTFQGNEITTNIGNYKLSTKINNKLRWINFEDRYSFLNYSISQLKLYNSISPSYLSNTSDNIHSLQNEVNKKNFNINLHTLKIDLVADKFINLLNPIDNYGIVLSGSEINLLRINSSSTYSNYYQISKYTESQNSFFINSKNVDFKNFNYFDQTTYYLNNLSLDYLNMTELSENKVILLNQQKNNENNLYYNKKCVLFSIVVLNPDISFSQNDLHLLNLYRYNYDNKQYEVLNINIPEYINFVTNDNGKLYSMEIFKSISLNKIDSEDINKDYYLGYKGIMNNMSNIKYVKIIPNLKKYTGSQKNIELNYYNQIVPNPDTINIKFKDGNILEITIKKNGNMYIPNEYLIGNFFINGISHQLSFMLTHESLKFINEAGNLKPEIKIKLLITNQLIPIINENNENDFVKNKSFLTFTKNNNEKYNYVYECINGKYNKDLFFEIDKELYYRFTSINYYERIQKRSLYLRSYKINLNNSLSINDRDYYNDFSLIGIPNDIGLDQTNNRYLNSTISVISKSMICKLDRSLNCFNTLSGYTSNSVEDNNSFLYFNFIDIFSLDINVIASKNNYYNSRVILNILENNSLPLKISIISLDNVSIYNYYVQNIEFKDIKSNGRLRQIFKLNMLPIDGSFDEYLKLIPFRNIEDKTSKCIMLVHNTIDYKKINLLNLNRPDYSYFFKKYYSILEATMLSINNSNSLTYQQKYKQPNNIFNYSTNIDNYLIKFLKYSDFGSESEIGQQNTTDSNLVCLKDNNDITVVNINGNKYIFNNEPYNSSIKYSLSKGIYTFNVPNDHPIAIINHNKQNLIYYTGENLIAAQQHTDGNNYNFYTGKITIEVYGDFGTLSYWCIHHGSMGGDNKLIYDDSCKPSIIKITKDELFKEYGDESQKNNFFTIHYKPDKEFSISYPNDNSIIIDNHDKVIRISKKYGIYDEINNNIDYYSDLELEIIQDTNISYHIFQIKEISSPNYQTYDLFFVKDNNIDIDLNTNVLIKFKFIIKHNKNVNYVTCLIPKDRMSITTTFESSILRISLLNSDLSYQLKYLELFIGRCISKYTTDGNIQVSLYKYEAKFKKIQGHKKIDNFLNLSNGLFVFNFYTCIKKIYLRPYISKLINPELNNLDRDENNNQVNRYLPTFINDSLNDEYLPNKYSNYLQFYENNLNKLSPDTNFLDICNYNQYGINYKTVTDGIIHILKKNILIKLVPFQKTILIQLIYHLK